MPNQIGHEVAGRDDMKIEEFLIEAANNLLLAKQ